jgi:enoyl-CoA hydratase/carnithine racemase
MPEFLIYEQDGPLVTLTMNQPEQRNPLTGNTAVPELLAAIDRIHDDHRVRCVILTGNGPSFCAGGDIREMKRQATPAVSELDIRHDYRRGIQRLTLSLFNLEVPVIAAVNGHAIGAGLDLACMCDIRIASTEAKFAEGFIKLGIIPGDGGAWLLPRIVGMSRAAELALTGDTIDAQQALAWNLVSRVVPHDELLTAARALASRITRHASHGVRLTKRLLRESIHSRLETVLELSAVFQAISHKTADHGEAVDAFLEKRAPRFSGE